MLRLRAHDVAAPGADGERELPRAPAMAFAGEAIAQAQQELVHMQHVQHQQQGPLGDASGQVGGCSLPSTLDSSQSSSPDRDCQQAYTMSHSQSSPSCRGRR